MLWLPAGASRAVFVAHRSMGRCCLPFRRCLPLRTRALPRQSPKAERISRTIALKTQLSAYRFRSRCSRTPLCFRTVLISVPTLCTFLFFAPTGVGAILPIVRLDCESRRENAGGVRGIEVGAIATRIDGADIAGVSIARRRTQQPDGSRCHG